MTNDRELMRLVQLRKDAYADLETATKEHNRSSLELARAQERFFNACAEMVFAMSK